MSWFKTHKQLRDEISDLKDKVDSLDWDIWKERNARQQIQAKYNQLESKYNRLLKDQSLTEDQVFVKKLKEVLRG